jgi:CCR4-NOT transcription complex subunit 2
MTKKELFFTDSTPGQPPQRPPNLGPTPALNAPFRPLYPGYGLARGVIPTSFPALTTHRAQSIAPQPTPNYIQRSQQTSGFPFQAGLAGQQQHPPLQHPQPSQQPQQSTNSSNLLPPNSTTPNLGTNHSASSASEVFDPNDFPALGSTPATNLTSNQTNVTQNSATSYATQASGTTLSSGNTQGGTTGLTEEDFPALGGSQASHQTSQNQSQHQSQHHDLSHPPGLNGFNDQHHRPGVISGITSGTQQPGVLNIGQQQRLHQFQPEAEKRVSPISYEVFFFCGPRPLLANPKSRLNTVHEWLTLL